MSKILSEKLAAAEKRADGAEFTLKILRGQNQQVAVYQTAIRNLFKLAQNPILVCPNCGHVWTAGPKDDVRESGYRLCEICLATVPDPWADKPSEYALAK
jgi:hypothetical protein